MSSFQEQFDVYIKNSPNHFRTDMT